MSEASIVRAAQLRRLRLATGLVVLFYLVTHLLNHAAGLIGLAAMESVQKIFLFIWQGPIGTVVLYGALAVHVSLAYWSIYQRRQWLMPARDAAQLLFGLAIPYFLAGHIADTRIAHDWFGAANSYTRILIGDHFSAAGVVEKPLLLLLAWGHGFFGLHYWLRLKPWYRRFAPTIALIGWLIPLLALLGYAEALREVNGLAAQPGWLDRTLAALGGTDAELGDRVGRISGVSRAAFTLLLVATLVARHVRNRYERRHQSIRVTYPGGQVVTAPIGRTLLEISRQGAIPHASVCGGRGRCSTCRVRIVGGLELLPAATPEELAVLRRVGAPIDVRLACQIRPANDVAAIPLLPASMAMREGAMATEYLQGEEREIAVLFADLRGFTRFSERKLPYDVVFFLNRYFETMGSAIERAGGIANQFTGDGVMALFGLETGAQQGARDAVAAAQAIAQGVATMNADLALQLDEPLSIGIGIHAGPAVVGRMGRGVAMYLTAVGDTVHVASRLQDLTKQFHCQLVISEQSAGLAGVDVTQLPRQEIAVRNRNEPVAIRIVADAAQLPMLPAEAKLAG